MGCSGFIAETPPSWAKPGMAVHCDETGRWAFVDLALATAGLFLLASAGGKGIDAYGATAGTVVFGASSVVGFRRAGECRCLHRSWLEKARAR